MKRDKRLTDTKERLFAAALELFAVKGVDAISVRDIARRVGIAAAGFYNHFRSKDELLQAVYDYYQNNLIEPQSRADADIGAQIAELGAVELFIRCTERFRVAMENPVLEKLGRIISLEKNRNEVAAEISFGDRQKLLRFMEALFVELEKKGALLKGNARVLGRMFGYIQLGIAEDNIYFRYMKKMSVDEILQRQNEEMKLFLRELTGG